MEEYFMFKTEICEMFGIEYPVILGGMVWIGKSELTAAVSEAGGLGLLAAGGMTIAEIEEEIALIKQKTAKPFGVNIPLMRPDAEEMIEVSVKGGAAVITTSAGSPKRFTQKIQDSGCRVMHVVSSVAFARNSAEAGVDVIVAEGFEAGGHNGFDEIATMALVPQVVDAVDVPVVAAGGISDGRGFVAALALGARGVQVGTRFVATTESAAHPNFKSAIIEVPDNGTTITGRTAGGPTRCIKNRLTEMIHEAERRDASKQELLEMIGEGRSALASINGDIEDGSVYCGQIGGLIREIKSVQEVIDDLIEEARKVVESFRAFITE
jgi:enoyl-[acyl-carrier protein] reductase II